MSSNGFNVSSVQHKITPSGSDQEIRIKHALHCDVYSNTSNDGLLLDCYLGGIGVTMGKLDAYEGTTVGYYLESITIAISIADFDTLNGIGTNLVAPPTTATSGTFRSGSSFEVGFGLNAALSSGGPSGEAGANAGYSEQYVASVTYPEFQVTQTGITGGAQWTYALATVAGNAYTGPESLLIDKTLAPDTKFMVPPPGAAFGFKPIAQIQWTAPLSLMSEVLSIQFKTTVNLMKATSSTSASGGHANPSPYSKTYTDALSVDLGDVAQ